MARSIFSIASLCSLMLLVSCSHTPPYRYEYVAGKTAMLNAGIAILPPKAPASVLQALEAGNRIVGKPYIYGGGHGLFEEKGYDCSGTASYVLHHAGFLKTSAASDEFRNFGKPGKGEWITVYAKRGHVFTVVAGLRLDTGYFSDRHDGPGWSTASRPTDGFVMRHPDGY